MISPFSHFKTSPEITHCQHATSFSGTKCELSSEHYLIDLARDDLIAELVQNDLDQDAFRTVIAFEKDRLVCEGMGLLPSAPCVARA